VSLRLLLSTSSPCGRNLTCTEAARYRGIAVSVHPLSAGLTTESSLTLAVRFCRVSAHATRARRIARVYKVQGNTREGGLIGEEGTELPKRPIALAIALRTSNRALGSLPNVPEFFNRYRLVLLFGFLHNPFGDDMIGVFLESGLLTRELFQMPLCTFCPPLLQALTQGMMPLSVLFNGLPTERLAGTVGCQLDTTEVLFAGKGSKNTEDIRGHFGFRGRNVKGHSQIENTLAIKQIGLPLDLVKPGLLIATDTERKQYTAREGQQRNSGQSLEGHHPLIIDNGTLRLKGRLNALITLVRIGCFADSANSQLCREFVDRPQGAVAHLLQFKLVGDFRRISLLGNVITGSIEDVYRLKQSSGLFSCRRKLQEHRLFHDWSITDLSSIANSGEDTQPITPQKEGSFLPRIHDGGFLSRQL